MRCLVTIILLAGYIALSNPAAFACSCADPLPPRKEMKKVRAVFTGEVIEVKELTHLGELTDDKYLYAMKFKVEKYWKGIKHPEIVVLTNLPLGDCGNLCFEEGKKYLVYAFGKKLVAYGCRQNKKLEFASEDMKELGEERLAENLKLKS
jgi:hypothetical protein